MAARLDLRAPRFQQTLARSSFKAHHANQDFITSELQPFFEEIFANHLTETPLANGEDSWIYKQKLIRSFNHFAFWDNLPNTIEYIDKGIKTYASLDEFISLPVFSTIYKPLSYRYRMTEEAETNEELIIEHDYPYLNAYHLRYISKNHRGTIFKQREIISVKTVNGMLICNWASRTSPQLIIGKSQIIPVEVISTPFYKTIGFNIHKTTDDVYKCVILNADNEIIQWLLRIKESCLSGDYGLSEDQYYRLVDLLLIPVHYDGHEKEKFINYVLGWKKIDGLPKNLYPPDLENWKDSFGIKQAD